MIPMDRRQFIKVTAITGTTAALASCVAGFPREALDVARGPAVYRCT